MLVLTTVLIPAFSSKEKEKLFPRLRTIKPWICKTRSVGPKSEYCLIWSICGLNCIVRIGSRLWRRVKLVTQSLCVIKRQGIGGI